MPENPRNDSIESIFSSPHAINPRHCSVFLFTMPPPRIQEILMWLVGTVLVSSKPLVSAHRKMQLCSFEARMMISFLSLLCPLPPPFLPSPLRTGGAIYQDVRGKSLWFWMSFFKGKNMGVDLLETRNEQFARDSFDWRFFLIALGPWTSARCHLRVMNVRIEILVLFQNFEGLTKGFDPETLWLLFRSWAINLSPIFPSPCSRSRITSDYPGYVLVAAFLSQQDLLS